MLLLVLLTLATALAYVIRQRYTFWQRKGFPIDGPNFPFGCLESVVKRQRSFGMAIHDVYLKSTEKFVGIYLTFRPALLIRDPALARNIMTQSFGSFHDRGVYVDEENNPFSGNLFALKGERWRTLRAKLTPSFTSGKLKGMFGVIDDVGNRMLEHLDKIVPDNGEITMETKELFSAYAIDIIGSVIFGLDINSFKEPKNPFKAISDLFNEPTTMSVLRGTAAFLCPSLEKIFFRMGLEDKISHSLTDIVRQTVELRESNNIVRKDLMQLLIQLRNTGKVNSDDAIWDIESTAKGFKSMSIETIAGQGFLFYSAGFATSAAASAFTVFELAQNPELLAKAQKDVEQALANHDGKITYESVQDMKYLDLCVMETNRKYPGLPILNRECTKDFEIPGSDKIIEKGTPIVIPLFGFHRDPEYFPEPLKYDPERFLQSNENYNPVAYMPFGEGPRHCIAQRMGQIVVKVALAKVLSKFNVNVTEKAEIEIDNFAVGLEAKGGVNVIFSKRKTEITK